MNVNELARKLAVDAGQLVSGLRAHAAELGDSSDETQVSMAKEVLGNEGDRAGHNYLTQQLATLRPADAVISEEDAPDTVRGTSQLVWIVDPLDGTSEYSSGRSDYAVHVALWDANSNLPGKIAVASVAVPELDKVWSMDDTPIAPSTYDGPIRILVSRTRPPRELDRVVADLEEAFAHRGPVQIIQMGSVGAKVSYMLDGNADVYLNTGGFFEWDLAAPLGVACHHGLVVCQINGEPFSFNQANLKLTGALICRPELQKIILNSLA